MKTILVTLIWLLGFGTSCSQSEETVRKLSDTGQTRSYARIFGDDGDYEIRPPAYTKLDDTGKVLPDDAGQWAMVRDDVTGLVWEVKTEEDGVRNRNRRFTWYNADAAANGGHAGLAGDGTDTQDYIDALNGSNFGGVSGWRLPTVKELSTIVNSGRHNPAIFSDYFPQTVPDNYWTSTPDVTNRNYAWLVNFDTGLVPYGFNKTDSYYVRAVYGARDGFSPDLKARGDGTVIDRATGLMWQRATVEADRWDSAISYCETLVLANHDDWRLPNRNELQSLVDYAKTDPSIDESAFPDTLASYYWTSTTYAPGPSRSWVVSFHSGYVHFSNKSMAHPFRAVRGP